MPRPAQAVATVEPDIDAAPVLLTPERARLADALAAVAAVAAEIATTPALITEAEFAHHVAYNALEEAERALARTKTLAASSFVPPPRPPASFCSEGEVQAYEVEQSSPPVPIAEARQAVEAATEAKQSTDATLKFLRAKALRLDEDLRSKRSAVQDARRRVIKASPELAALATEAKRLATRLASATLAFQSATGNEYMPPGTPFHDIASPSKWTDDPDSWTLSRRWHASLDQLETDPAAVLPMPEPVP